MYFRRELDFDELIETIDQLADEEIDEVVDWQMTDSAAAKTEKASKTASLGPNWRVSGDRSGYTMNQLAEMRSAVSGVINPAIPGAPWIRQEVSRSRFAVPPGVNEIAIPEAQMLNFANPLEDDSPWQLIRTQRISFDVQFDVQSDPMMEVLHIRLKWSVNNGIEWHYQQMGLTWEAMVSLRATIEILRAPNVLPGRDIVVELDPERMRMRRDTPVREGLQVYIESAS